MSGPDLIPQRAVGDVLALESYEDRAAHDAGHLRAAAEAALGAADPGQRAVRLSLAFPDQR